MATGVQMVYVTFPDRQTAGRIGRMLVERGLAACANILGEIHSCYRWEGELCEGAEVAVILKTHTDSYPALQAAIQEAHPYDLPCVVAWELAAGFPPFLDWVRQESAFQSSKKSNL